MKRHPYLTHLLLTIKALGFFFSTNSGDGNYGLGYGDGDFSYSASSRRSRTTSFTADNENWHLVTLVISGSDDMQIYVDCENVGTAYSGSGGDLLLFGLGWNDRET